MNRILRHRLRNLCAGMRLGVESVAARTAESNPGLRQTYTLMLAELNDLLRFTKRMDALFGELPPAEPMTLSAIGDRVRNAIGALLPAFSFSPDWPESDAPVAAGSRYVAILEELVLNAAEAAGAAGRVELSVTQGPPLEFVVANAASSWPKTVPTVPPCPFTTTRSRHDGIGLAIVQRLCDDAGADWQLSWAAPGCVTVTVSVRQGEAE